MEQRPCKSLVSCFLHPQSGAHLSRQSLLLITFIASTSLDIAKFLISRYLTSMQITLINFLEADGHLDAFSVHGCMSHRLTSCHVVVLFLLAAYILVAKSVGAQFPSGLLPEEPYLPPLLPYKSQACSMKLSFRSKDHLYHVQAGR